MLQFNGVSLNKESMMETEAVFQLLTSWLKVEALLKAWYLANERREIRREANILYDGGGEGGVRRHHATAGRGGARRTSQ